MEDKIKILERERDLLNILKDMLYEKEAYNDSEESINKLKLEIAKQKNIILDMLRNRDHVDEEKIKEFIKSLEEKY
jgi:hypothetical protein